VIQLLNFILLIELHHNLISNQTQSKGKIKKSAIEVIDLNLKVKKVKNNW